MCRSHGTNAKGSPLGPDLTSGTWLWGDGSLAAITSTFTAGVPPPKKYGAPMPPMGGAGAVGIGIPSFGGR